MKKIIFFIGMMALFIMLPDYSYAQTNKTIKPKTRKKTKMELPCGCEIDDLNRICGKCGGFLSEKGPYYPTDDDVKKGILYSDYKCKACPHKHDKLNAKFIYGHVCNEGRCVKKYKIEINGNPERIQIRIENVCPKGYAMIMMVRDLGLDSGQLPIAPKESWMPDYVFSPDECRSVKVGLMQRKRIKSF